MRAGSEERPGNSADERAFGSDAGVLGGDERIVRRNFADAAKRAEECGETAREGNHFVGKWEESRLSAAGCGYEGEP